MPFRSPFSLTPWVRRLLIANAVVYLLTITVFTGAWFDQLFAFRPEAADVQPWTFITYMFVHGGFLHLAFNLLMIFFFGPAVEDRMGGAAFLRYYLLCGLGGAALSFVLMLVTPIGAVMGSSAAALGVALAFAFHWPDTPVYVFPLPVPVKVKWLVVFLFAMDLLYGMGGARDGIAHFAHVGGFLFGFAYLKTEQVLASKSRPVLPRRNEARVLARQSGEVARASRAQQPSARSQSDAVQREMDRVLDKISASGLASLTAAEKRFLYEASRQMKRE
jgi:membrane associated rhomboid family serine protease